VTAVGRPVAGQFAFPYVGGNDVALCRKLMSDFGVRVTPGAIWGAMGDGHLRIALSNPAELHAEGLRRLARGLSRRHPG